MQLFSGWIGTADQYRRLTDSGWVGLIDEPAVAADAMPANGDHYKPDGPDNCYSDALVVDDARISSGGDGSSETQSALANLPVSQYISEALRWHAADAFISDSGTDRLGGTASSSSPTSPRSSPRLAARLSLLYPPTAWGELWILYPPGSFLYDHWIAAGLAAIVRNLRPPVPAHCGIRAVWSIRMVNTTNLVSTLHLPGDHGTFARC